MNKNYDKGFLAFAITISFVAMYISFQTLYEITTMGGNEEFYKTLFSSLIGGLSTILGVGLTVLYYMKRDLYNKKKDKRDERLRIRPYLRAKKFGPKDEKGDYDFKVELSKKIIKDDVGLKFIELRIENIGFGPAIDIQFEFELPIPKDRTKPSEKKSLIQNSYKDLVLYYDYFPYDNNEFIAIIKFKDLYDNDYEAHYTIRIKSDNYFEIEMIKQILVSEH